MLFNSYEYIFLFLPASFFLYFYLHKLRLALAAKTFLIGTSLFFYAWWETSYLIIILISVFFNFMVGNFVSKNFPISAKRKKTLLLFGITANLALLGYFKYTDFLLENLNLLFDLSLPYQHIVLPLAISFFTFQQIAYLVDAYRGDKKNYSFLDYSLFVTFFPQLIAGPIVHHKEMMPQFASKYNWVIRHKNIVLGLFIFSIGLFKKVIIADSFAIWANRGFDIAHSLNMLEAWFTSLAYTIQLYFDFSGYTDMAIGAALLFNIRLPINFYSPYKALNIRDFWRRWHITLTRFLRDYLYITLGGNRSGTLKTYRNIIIVFLLGGIWHGAGWTFVVWGLLHGIALVTHRIWQLFAFTMPRWLAWFVTFNFVNISWVFFRAKDFNDAVKVLKGMFLGDLILPAALLGKLHFLNSFGVKFGAYLDAVGAGAEEILKMVVMLAVVLFAKNSIQLTFESNISYAKMFYSAILFIVSVLSMNKISEFIYFNF
ncbi:MBOAT family O-acyltransferase [Hydrogenimonas cancrithermarum]|uniref:Peptidoglycan O-acetyltransferase n=1 Tax=Hydrogenimonas cancrithermarum TaxID=2993563 RepID=A0ABN6WZA0_9BACT|nr:MBOAT family O-acyltransferase [Hydrogenimonas cancrithermarum]BDY13582.1 peptidoglycan O-acetyltransferase [Hydrogenimonas cancrithermarum]